MPQRLAESQRETMFKESKEYSLAQLLEHPILELMMTGEGMERRCVELMLDSRATSASARRSFSPSQIRSSAV
jgi:hypothetical protein